MGKFIKEHLLIITVLLVSLFIAISFSVVAGKNITIPFTPTPTPTAAPLATKLSYKGEAGKDALTLLKKRAKIEQASSGLIIAINGRKADDKMHEFWAFYVNGEFASTGPADYQTKDTDTIMWKIEKY
jgi:hypothetical protein